MGRLVTALAAVVLMVMLYAGFRPLGPVPPLGRLLNPADGFWSAAATASHPGASSGRIPALGAGVRVIYDDRGVPHIFASSTLDAVRALGWVVARDRLLQMDVQARAGEGSLTELAGARAIEADETPRRLGMRWGAERKLAAMDTASEGARVMAAYAEGVNAYLDALPAAGWPVEYRLLGARPSRWSPLRSVYLLQRMAWTLSYDRLELDRARVAALVGAEAAASLFPVNSPIQEPIVPRATVARRLQPERVAPPGRPDAEAAAIANLLALASPPGSVPDEPARGTIGSNSWAVAPSRSASGHALLAGDPHLGLTLPSIWYEAHLVVPGELDVYGVTIPGAPGIIIGFNRDVAWTFTNSYGDVMDYWAETVDDSLRPTRYRVDGEWRPLETRLETYRAPDGSAIRTDTIRIGHRGPLVREGRRWLSIRWTALEPSNEMDGFTRAARARSAREYLDLLGSAYRVPAQNALAADRGGHIAVRATGRFPLRADGARIHDGGTSASDWTGWRALAQWPQAFDPPQGFLATANQQAVDPRVDSLYYGADFRDPWRALRINALLRADSSVTVDDMRRWQTDPGSARADLFVPWFLEAAGRSAAATPDAALEEAARLLAAWDRRYVRESEGAVLFEAAMRELADRTWDELVPAGRTRGEPGARVATPGAYVFASLLPDAANAWWDDRATPAIERRDDILAASLRAALQRVRNEHGEPGERWRWGRVHSANIPHLLYLRPFGAYGLDVQGGPNTLAPSAGRGMDGPSWRMVVELGPEVRAWATYPGGQSGNPASPRYRDRIPQWQAGELDPVLVPRTPADIPAARVSGELKLEGGR